MHVLARLLDAANFSAARHRNQRRKSASAAPYVNHPIEVANELAAAGVDDAEVLIAALLHDTVEDTGTRPRELEERFGAAVRRIVEEVSDDKALPKQERKRLQVEHAPSLSHGAKLVKLGDKICNVREISLAPPHDWSADRKHRYFDWAAVVVAGCRGANAALERRFDEVLGLGRNLVR